MSQTLTVQTDQRHRQQHTLALLRWLRAGITIAIDRDTGNNNQTVALSEPEHTDRCPSLLPYPFAGWGFKSETGYFHGNMESPEATPFNGVWDAHRARNGLQPYGGVWNSSASGRTRRRFLSRPLPERFRSDKTVFSSISGYEIESISLPMCYF